MALHLLVTNTMAKSNWRRKDVSLQVIVHIRERTGQEPRQELEVEIIKNTAVDLFFIACLTILLSPGPLCRDDTPHNDLSSLSINNQANASKTHPQVHLIEAVP